MGDLESLSPAQRIAYARQQSTQADEANLENNVAAVSHWGSLGAGAVLAARGGWLGLATFGAAVGGGYVGSELAKATHMDELMAGGLEAVGMHRVGAGGPNAATIGHQVAHTYGFGGFLANLAIGALAALAVGALIVATGGVAAVALIGAAAAGGFAAGFLGGPLQSALSQMGAKSGPIITGSRNTYINKKKVARMTDLVQCSKESKPVPLIEGCGNVWVNNLPMVRVGHKTSCGATVDEGSPNVHLNDKVTASCGVPAPDVPLWASVLGDWIFFLPLGKGAGWLAERNSLISELMTRAKFREAQIRATMEVEDSGPVLTILKDRKTGQLFEGLNQKDPPADLHPVLQQRLEQMKADYPDGKFPHYSRPGTHSEVYALNDALNAREAAGMPVTEADINGDNFALYNRWLTNPPNPAPTCQNCTYLTQGVTSFSGNK